MEKPGAKDWHDIFTGLLGRLPEFGVNPGKTALMIIDMQYGSAHRDYGHIKRAREAGAGDAFSYYLDRVWHTVVPNLQRLQQACRGAGIPVIHVHIASATPDGSDTSWRYKCLGIIRPLGSKEAGILEELAPLPGEVVLRKTTSSAFISTNAHRVLRNMGIDTIIMTGVVTNSCVESSTRGAGDLGFKVLLVDDACATYTPEAHQVSLRYLHRNFAIVTTTQEVLRQIAEARKAIPIPVAGS